MTCTSRCAIFPRRGAGGLPPIDTLYKLRWGVLSREYFRWQPFNFGGGSGVVPGNGLIVQPPPPLLSVRSPPPCQEILKLAEWMLSIAGSGREQKRR